METPRVYHLPQDRLFRYPYRLHAVGWMPRHLHFHCHAVITDMFVCLSSNRESEADTIVNGELTRMPSGTAPSFSLILPGTTMHSLRESVHDELFFHYPAECAPALAEFFGPELIGKRRITPPGFPEPVIAELRHELENLPAPGAADRLDQLAIRLFTEILLQYRSRENRESASRMKLHSIAAAMQEGKALAPLLRKHGLSERTFYREWGKLFALSPHRYKLEQQLNRAAALLTETELTVSEVASSCGFPTATRFHQSFRQKFDTSPLRYRAEARQRLLPDKPAKPSSATGCYPVGSPEGEAPLVVEDRSVCSYPAQKLDAIKH